MASERSRSSARKVHLAQIKLAPIYFPILFGSGPSRFRAQIQQPDTLSDLINFVSFGRLFCQDLDLAILLHQDVHLAQTELYQIGSNLSFAPRWLSRSPRWRTPWLVFRRPPGVVQSRLEPVTGRPLHVVGHLISTCPAALHDRAFPRIRKTQKDTGTHRAQPLAELSLTERSEVLRPSEARCSVASEASPLCRAGGAELN